MSSLSKSQSERSKTSRRIGPEGACQFLVALSWHSPMEATLLTSPNTESRKRALLVEPNVDSQRLCQDALERCGFIVDTVASGIQAVVCARSSQQDIILMDLQLPDVPCPQAIGWLRCNAALRLTPILVLNGGSTDSDKFAEAVPVAVIPRPLSMQSLQRAIQRASAEESSARAKLCN